MVLMLASIGLYIAVQNIVSLGFTDSTRMTLKGASIAGYAVFGIHVTALQFMIVVLTGAALCGTWLLLRFSPLGLLLRAIAGDADLANVSGICVPSIRVVAAGLGGALAGLAGVLTSLDTGLVPSMGFQALLWAVLACVIGGTNRFVGAIAGGVLLGLVNQLGVWKVGTQWQDAVLFLVMMMIFFLSRPQGLFGQAVGRAKL